MRNRRGFVMVAFVSLLPLMLAAVTFLYVVIGFSEDRGKALYQCRKDLLLGLEAAGKPMKALIELNPVAHALQLQKVMATAALGMATASANPAAIALAVENLESVQARQEILETQQKVLYQAARFEILKAQTLAFADVTTAPSLVFKNWTHPFSAVRPALHPEGSGPAPVYVLDQPFHERQRVVQEWQSFYRVQGPLAHFLKAEGAMEEKCSATLRPEGSVWRAELAEDKS